MTHDEFSELINAFGSKSDNWPIEHREDMLHFIEQNPAIADSASQADKSLDQWLDGHDVPAVSDLLESRILAAAKRDRKPKPRWSYRNIAASLVIISVIGVGLGSSNFWSEPTADAEAWSEAANDLGLSDIYTWVEGDTETTLAEIDS